jgi:hypothetical protein
MTPCLSKILEHLSFNIMDKWYILSEYCGWKKGNTEGGIGDIRGKPRNKIDWFLSFLSF